MNNIKNFIKQKWSGGITREIYRDQENFNIRISCAEIDPGENLFSEFVGYKRILKILENSVTLVKNNDRKNKIFLDKTNKFIFQGSDKISSKNEDLVLDFNIIYKLDYAQVCFEEINGTYCSTEDISYGEQKLIFSIENDGIAIINNYNYKFKKYDFLILDHLDSYSLNGQFILVKFKKQIRCSSL